jgi:hypothetical protein
MTGSNPCRPRALCATFGCWFSTPVGPRAPLPTSQHHPPHHRAHNVLKILGDRSRARPAHAMDAPMQGTKPVALHFGGSHNGMVNSWPARIKERGGIGSQCSHNNRVVPTKGFWCSNENSGHRLGNPRPHTTGRRSARFAFIPWLISQDASGNRPGLARWVGSLTSGWMRAAR